MTQRRWFYLDAEGAIGPFDEQRIRAQLSRGTLGPQTPVWHDGAVDWLPAALALEHAPARVDDDPVAADAALVWHDEAPHPVRRYFARILDIGAGGLLASAALFLGLYALAPGLALHASESLDTTAGRAVDLLLSILVGGLMAAIPLGLTGTTPGKWLFGIQVLDQHGEPAGVRLALARELRVWVWGLGLGVPVLSLLTLGLSYQHLMRHGRSRWDEALGLRVRHRPLGPVQVVTGAIGLVAIASLIWLQRT